MVAPIRSRVRISTGTNFCLWAKKSPRGCGCGFGKNPPAGLGKIRPQADPWVHFCTRTRLVSGGFRVSADLTTAIIRITIQHSNKMKLTINP